MNEAGGGDKLCGPAVEATFHPFICSHVDKGCACVLSRVRRREGRLGGGRKQERVRFQRCVCERNRPLETPPP